MTSIDLHNLIQNFNNENLVRFIEWKSQDFKPIKEEIDEIEAEGFENIQKLGEIQFSTSEALILCSIKVTKNLTERSGKKTQFELAKKVLKYYADAYDGIFVFYDDDGNFRFSLIYANYLENRRSLSNYRRFTYFVSKDLTNNTFTKRMETGDFSTLDGIKETFSVEKVTKVFYEEISNWYFWACQLSKFPPAAEREENGRQVGVIRLITRLIFVWFMREKGLIPADLFNKKVITECLVNLDDDKSSYYQAILQNLFFATLNTPQQERRFRAETRGHSGYNPDYGNQYVYHHQSLFSQPGRLEEYFKDIPFLNGGLFECLDNTETGDYFDGFSDTIKNQTIVPNLLFFSPETSADLNAELGTSNKQYKVKGLLETLSDYNFTIDENTTDDKEVALDPELLGQVFENLLASFNPETSTTARRGTGSYYTPREIVDYMVDESLKAYLCQYLEDIPDIDQKLTWLLSQEQESNPFTKKEGSRIVKLVEEVRIVDPAVGSGAFPMGALNKLVLILSKLDPDGNLWEQAQLDAAQLIPDSQIRVDVSEQIRKSFLEKNHDYGRKLYLIQKCIYGVDIQQIAVEITKLRFFISLLVDETVVSEKENWGIEPLPNLDFKIMQGNSLISTFEGIDLGPKVKEPVQQDDLFSGQGEKARLIANLQNLKEQYQTVSDHMRKRELQKEIDQYFLEIFKLNALEQHQDYATRLAAIDRKYQGVPDPKTREKLKAIEKEKISSEMGININASGRDLNSYSTKQVKRDFFPWGLFFAEVFEEKGGFDIAMSNPPYLNSRSMSKTDKATRDKIQSAYELTRGSWDLYIAFYELSLNISNAVGFVIFITPDKWISKPFGEALRTRIIRNIKSILKVGRGVFDSANVDAIVTLISKSDHRSLEILDIKDDSIYQKKMIEKSSLDAPYAFDWLFSDFDNLLSKIGNFPNKLGDLGVCESACATDDAYKLRPLIIDLPSTLSNERLFKIINTGTIGKYHNYWGVKEMVYLGNRYLTPVVPKDVFLHHFPNTYGEKSSKPKIILKGLNLLDACPDFAGEIIPGIPTLIFSSDHIENLKVSLAIINSPLTIFYIKEKYPGFGYNLGITFTKDMINDFPVPELSDRNKRDIIYLIDKIIDLESTDQTDVLKKELNGLINDLYELTDEEVEIINTKA